MSRRLFPVMLNNDIPSVHEGVEALSPGSNRNSYLMFHELAHDMHFPLHFASPYDYNWQTNEIEGYYEPDGGTLVPIIRSFNPSFIFDKASGADPHCTAVIDQFESAGVPIFGPRDLARLCCDKWRIFMQFARFSPLTALLPQDRSLIVERMYRFFEEMDRTYSHHDNRVVVKPLHGFQSRGIHRISRGPVGLEMHMLFGGQISGTDIERNLDFMATTPYLIQAWVNTGAGIPGVGLEGESHDVRFIFRIRERGQAEFIMLYVKTLDGMKYIPLAEFAQSNPFEVVNPIADWMAAHFPYGIFSVDVMRDESGRWFLTELNDQVGLTLDFSSPQEVAEMERFMRIYLFEMARYAENSRHFIR